MPLILNSIYPEGVAGNALAPPAEPTVLCVGTLKSTVPVPCVCTTRSALEVLPVIVLV